MDAIPTSTKDVDFISFIIKSIVDEPEKVEISRRVDDLGVLIEIRVAKNDMGKIVGRDGKTAKAMRTLVRQIGSQEGNRVNLKILEPVDGDENDMHVPNPGISIDDDSIFG